MTSLDPEYQLSVLRESIHRFSTRAFAFRLSNWSLEERSMLYGALDALQDASGAARSYRSLATVGNSQHVILCYGFLQALYVQQDAVVTITRALGLPVWRPSRDPDVGRIRNVRNRLCGHPALAENPGPRSSAIITSIGVNGFSGIIYFENDLQRVDVDVDQFSRANAVGLCKQLEEIEAHMKAVENEFKDRVGAPLVGALGPHFAYHLTKLVIDHTRPDEVLPVSPYVKWLRESADAIEQAISALGVGGQGFEYHLKMFRAGLDILAGIGDGTLQRPAAEYDLIYDGMRTHAAWLESFARDTDAELSLRD